MKRQKESCLPVCPQRTERIGGRLVSEQRRGSWGLSSQPAPADSEKHVIKQPLCRVNNYHMSGTKASFAFIN